MNNKIENPILPSEEFCNKTRNTLMTGIGVTAAFSTITAVTGAAVLHTASKVEDESTKKTILAIGGVGTGISAIITGVLFSRIPRLIDNHDDSIELNLLRKFLNAKSEEDKEAVIDTTLNELYEKSLGNK